jgi:hypothetical protein
MKIYLKDKITGKIHVAEANDFFSFSKNIRDLNDEATQEEADLFILNEAKNSKETQIKLNCKAFIYLPVEYNGLTFVNSEIASTNLQGAYTFAEEPIEWLDVDGNTVILTKLEMKDLANIMIAHRSTGYFLKASLINQVKACVTIEEVNNIIIDFNA